MTPLVLLPGMMCDVQLFALVLCGKDDILCPVSRHALMADCLSGATLKIIEGARHLPVRESPEETNAALACWMEN